MRGSARHTVAWLRVFVRACSRCSHPALAISLCCAAWKTLGPPRTTEWLPLRLRGKPTEKWAQTRWQTVVEWKKKIKKKPPWFLSLFLLTDRSFLFRRFSCEMHSTDPSLRIVYEISIGSNLSDGFTNSKACKRRKNYLLANASREGNFFHFFARFFS